MDTTTGTFPTFPQDTKVASLGGGHGLFQTLTAVRLLHPDTITAIVTVADGEQIEIFANQQTSEE